MMKLTWLWTYFRRFRFVLIFGGLGVYIYFKWLRENSKKNKTLENMTKARQISPTLYTDEFAKALEDVKGLDLDKLAVDTKLKLYAFYKQATVGKIDIKRPSQLEFTARSKYDAWKAIECMDQSEAQKEYSRLVTSLKESTKLNQENTPKTSSQPRDSVFVRNVSKMQKHDSEETVKEEERNDPWFLIKEGEVDQLLRIAKEDKQYLKRKDKDGLSALHWACDSGNIRLVQSLLNLDCDSEERDNIGLTPLAYAVINEHIDLAVMLVQQGCSLNSKDFDGESILDMASEEIKTALRNSNLA